MCTIFSVRFGSGYDTTTISSLSTIFIAFQMSSRSSHCALVKFLCHGEANKCGTFRPEGTCLREKSIVLHYTISFERR